MAQKPSLSTVSALRYEVREKAMASLGEHLQAARKASAEKDFGKFGAKVNVGT